MNVAILGYGVDGQSAAEYWHKKGDNVTICDLRDDIKIPEYAKAKLGADYLENLENFDLIVRTPGLHPSKIIENNPDYPDIYTKVTTTINEFFANCPGKIIGVTGTKGKGTTCTIIYKILQAAGKNTFLGGNIGVNPLDFLNEVTEDSWVVLELSSFQTIDIKYSPAIAVCLMVVPEHLNWHTNLQEYIDAKTKLFLGQTNKDSAIYLGSTENLFVNQKSDDDAVFDANNILSQKIASTSKGIHIPYSAPSSNEAPKSLNGAYVVNDVIYMQGTEICNTKDIALLGAHNLENVCAAIAAVWSIIGGDVNPIIQVVKTFTGLEHRIEFVREVDGVKYYNDSFATTPEAAIAAIKSFNQKVVLILGGSSKGTPLFSLISEIITGNARGVVVIGDTGPKILELLTVRGFSDIALGGNTMNEMVIAAKNIAHKGDVVLLSPACASFGLFVDYKDRGNQFKQVVNSL